MNVQRRAKIVATIGPATDTEESLEALLAAGVDVVRLNFSHGTHDEHARRLADGPGDRRSAAAPDRRDAGPPGAEDPDRHARWAASRSTLQARPELRHHDRPTSRAPPSASRHLPAASRPTAASATRCWWTTAGSS